MTEYKKLSKTAVGGVSGLNYEPYVSPKTIMPETNPYSIIIGFIMAGFFAIANTYLALKIGLTIAAAIPGAVIATAVLRGIFRRNNILETNMAAATGAVGEGLAGSIVFILPVILLWHQPLSLFTIVWVSVLGGALGVFFVAPIRQFLIVESHGTLLFPESVATAQVLVGSAGNIKQALYLVWGLGIGGGYKLLSNFSLFSQEPEWHIKSLGTIFGINNLPALMGVGLIIGLRAASYMFAGAIISWLGIIPLIKYFGTGLLDPVYPSSVPISDMGTWAIWSNYIRYLGAGAVATGGVISLIRLLPTIYLSIKTSIGAMSHKTKLNEKQQGRNWKEVPIMWVLIVALIVFFLVWFVPIGTAHLGFLGALLAVIFSFLFSIVSARMVGLVGATNNPVSGMTIATLLIGGSILHAAGWVGMSGMMVIVLFGSIVCIAAGLAGDTSQSLKHTFLIGGTPRNVQINMFFGVIIGAIFSAFVLFVMNAAYTVGSPAIPAPQAGIMALVIQGITTAHLPWVMVVAGVMFALAAWIMRLPIMMLALGLYLPIHLMAGLFIGGLLREGIIYINNRKGVSEKVKDVTEERSLMVASGLVAGGALLGVVVAILVVGGINIDFFKNVPFLAHNQWWSLLWLIGLIAVLYTVITRKISNK